MFKMVLFDVDGVMLSEERYFDASALTVYELINSPQYLKGSDVFTPQPKEEEIRRIRKEVFADDEVLSFMKSRGINANWDMVFLQFSYQLVRALAEIHRQHAGFVEQIAREGITRETLRQVGEYLQGTAFAPDYAGFVQAFQPSKAEKHELLLYLNDLLQRETGVKAQLFSRNSSLWVICQETFQEWYIGDELYEKTTGEKTRQPGKKGFLKDEIAIIDPKAFADLLAGLKEKGVELGIATGRPQLETYVPLEELGVFPYFSPKRVTTASDVLRAEEEYPERAPLSKPQPFQYLRSYLGADTPLAEIMAHDLPLPDGQEILIVGDSVADFLAARALGCRFAATLTGLTGQEARGKFEELGADYILNDVLDLKELFSVQ
jgi:phosphoglycolate phosphatase-like HAD superfamily hydrolase